MFATNPRPAALFALVFSALHGFSAAASPAEMKVGYGRVHPISYRDKDGQAAGFAVDVLNEAARRENIRLTWIPTQTSAESEEMLAGGGIDLLSAGMVTPDRQRRFFVSDPWWSTELTLLTRAGANGPIRVLALSPVYGFLARKAYPGAKFFSGKWMDDNLVAVCSGQADGLLLTHGELHSAYMHRPPGCEGTALDSGDTSIVIELAVISRRANEAVARRLRRRIDEMAGDGSLLRMAGQHPPISTAGAVRIAQQVQERSAARWWTIAVFLIIPVAIWAVLDSRRKSQPALRDRTMDEVLPLRSKRYLFAVLVALVAVGLRHLANPLLGFGVPFLFQSFAVAAAAQYGGIGAGLLSTAVCVLLNGFARNEPTYLGFFPKDSAAAIGLALFILLAISLSYLGERLITAKRLHREAERDREVEREHAAALASAERARAAQKAQLEALLESVAEPIFVTDSTGTVLKTNAAFRSLFEVRKTVRDYLPTEELRTLAGELVEPSMWPVNRVLRGERIRGVELRMRRADGSSLTLSYSGNPVADPRGTVTEAILTIQEITERKRLEDALRESEERLRLTLEGAEIGTFDYRPLTGEVFWDARPESLWGTNARRHLAYDEACQWVHPDDRPRFQREVASALQPDSDGALECEYRIALPDGSVRWAAVKGRAYFEGVEDQRRAVRLVGIHLDITERKVLRGLLPTCARCKNIRDEQGRWHSLEQYITEHSGAQFSHGICPNCVRQLYSDVELSA